MLFSSHEFLFGFLPFVIVATVFAARMGGRRLVFPVLIAASLVFYGWAYPPYLILLTLSIAGNYGFGIALTHKADRRILISGLVFNLGLLAYFKYAGFLAETFNTVSGATFSIGNIALPLAISFFTFQQIAYLVDVHQGKVRDTNFLHYCLFVTFFPQLIAGPIVHHADVIPQFEKKSAFRMSLANFWAGGAIFVIGLYKKVVFADAIAIYADGVFDSALTNPTLFEAWAGALAYTFQIYFDFSGYSDMAIGLARIFGIQLPINFHSPYKATSIIDFWRRWHMTLSRFLRDYLYYPMGGNKKGPTRRYVNLMVVMLLGGLWHGAGWAFVFWGGLHGFYLVVNHAWRRFKPAAIAGRSPIWNGLSRLLTFVAVVIAWVFFRAETGNQALSILSGMAGLNGMGTAPFTEMAVYGWLFVLLVIVWGLPNTQEWMAGSKPALDFDVIKDTIDQSPAVPPLIAKPALMVPVLISAAGIAALVVFLRGVESSPFIYMFF